MIIINLTCYTIGHSKHTVKQLVDLIKAHRINLVIDVRSIPFSRYAPQFNHTSIRYNFSQFALDYEFMGDILGGKFIGSEFLDENSCVDFHKLLKSKSFQKGIDTVVAKIHDGLTPVLMCAEKDPLYCHRFLLLSRELNNRGIRINHLMSDGNMINNDEILNNIAYGKHQSGYIQMNLFTNEEKIDMIYKLLIMKKNKKFSNK